MNCKPGDWAIVVPPGFKENLGKVVRCIELLKTDIAPDVGPLHPACGPVWVIDRPILWKSGSPVGGLVHKQAALACDDALMPISPPDNFKELEDELWLKQHAPVQA